MLAAKPKEIWIFLFSASSGKEGSRFINLNGGGVQKLGYFNQVGHLKMKLKPLFFLLTRNRFYWEHHGKEEKKSQNIKIFNFRIQVFVTLILLKLVQTFLKVEAQITSDKLGFNAWKENLKSNFVILIMFLFFLNNNNRTTWSEKSCLHFWDFFAIIHTI